MKVHCAVRKDRIILKNGLELCDKKLSNITEIIPISEGHAPEA